MILIQFYIIFSPAEVSGVIISGTREVMLADGSFGFELLYTVETSSSVTLNAQLTTSISMESITEVISTVTENRVSIFETSSTTIMTVSSSRSFFVSGMISQTDNALFIGALQTLYSGE